MKDEILLIPDKEDSETDQLAKVWESRGGEVKRIGKFWVKPEVGNKRVCLYGYDSFCLVLAQVLDLKMQMVKDESIAELPKKFLKREVQIIQVNEKENIEFPRFIKPSTPKLFKAEIFENLNQLNSKIDGIDNKERLICSEVIAVDKEVRSFILNNQIMDLAYYEGDGEIDQARIFINQVLNNQELEFLNTFVLDVGYNTNDGWFVIEFNSSWGAGLNYCDPEKVIECIREATVN